MVAAADLQGSRAGDCKQTAALSGREGIQQAGAAGPALPARRRSGPLGAQGATRSEQPCGPWFILSGMKLHNYFRSSSSFRVRIAMELKGLKYDYIPVHIAKRSEER